MNGGGQPWSLAPTLGGDLVSESYCEWQFLIFCLLAGCRYGCWFLLRLQASCVSSLQPRFAGDCFLTASLGLQPS